MNKIKDFLCAVLGHRYMQHVSADSIDSCGPITQVKNLSVWTECDRCGYKFRLDIVRPEQGYSVGFHPLP